MVVSFPQIHITLNALKILVLNYLHEMLTNHEEINKSNNCSVSKKNSQKENLFEPLRIQNTSPFSEVVDVSTM